MDSKQDMKKRKEKINKQTDQDQQEIRPNKKINLEKEQEEEDQIHPIKKKVKLEQDNNNYSLIKEADIFIGKCQQKIKQGCLKQKKSNKLSQLKNDLIELQNKLDKVIYQNEKLELDNILQQDNLNEEQYTKLFEQNLEENIVLHDVENDLYKGYEVVKKEIEYTSKIFTGKISLKIDYFDNPGLKFYGGTKLQYIDEDGKEIILQYQYYDRNEKLDPQIKQPEYNSYCFNITSVNMFISDVLNTKNNKNINQNKLFEQITKVFLNIQFKHYDRDIEL